MARLKSIQSTLIARIASQVPALNSKTVLPWEGAIEDFFEGNTRIHNLPFCGVKFTLPDSLIETFDNSVAEETYEWRLTVLADDARGLLYSDAQALDIVDDIRTALNGHALSGQAGVAPLKIGAVEPLEQDSERFTTAYAMTITTWQVRQ